MDPFQYQLEQYRRFVRPDGGFSSGALYLGGSSGSGGGSGTPPGGFIGQLPQNRVCFDTSELELSTGSSSLVDNLNHIRKRIYDLEMTSGSAAEGFYNTIQDGGVAREQRGTLNFVDGSGVSVLVADDSPNQRTNVTPALNINGLVEDETPDEDADYIATYDHSAGLNKKVLLSNLPFSTGSGGSGSGSTFLSLSDTPVSYSGQSGKVVAVNSGENALEFVESSGSGGGSSGSTLANVCVWVEIGSTELSSDASGITFLNIPSGYDELKVVARLRSARASVAYDAIAIYLNADGNSANYRMQYHQVYTTSTHNANAADGMTVGYAPAATATSDYFGEFRISINRYSESEYHTLLCKSGTRYDATNLWSYWSVVHWETANPITRISLLSASWYDLLAGSSARLYGSYKTDILIPT